MPSRINLKQNMSKDSRTYKQLITECPVTPKCFVTEDGNLLHSRYTK